jgi:hypothetical protein
MYLNKDCEYFIGTSVFERLSNSIKLEIFDNKDLIFSETFASSNIKYSNLFKEAPEILKYINDGVDITSFIEVFFIKRV